MAKMRIINTRFWIDDYVSNLDPTEKLLFLYFLTSPQTDICGVYEVPLKVVATETGIDRDMVDKIIKRFSKDGKIFYSNGWVAITNFKKHQSLNPKVERGIEIGLSKAPKELVKKINDSLSKPMDSLSHPNSNLNSNSNPNTTAKAVRVDASKITGEMWKSLIDGFELVNPLFRDFYKNRTERAALEALNDQIGYEKLLSTIQALPQIVHQEYAPKITKPTELRRDFGKLLAFYKQKTSGKSKQTIII